MSCDQMGRVQKLSVASKDLFLVPSTSRLDSFLTHQKKEAGCLLVIFTQHGSYSFSVSAQLLGVGTCAALMSSPSFVPAAQPL